MATQNKSQLHSVVISKVEQFCSDNKISVNKTNELLHLISSLLAPKTGGSTTQHPSYVEDNITYHYCRFHQQYEAEADMVMTQGKSKGYCKASISIWNKRNSAIKAKEAMIATLIINSDIDSAKAISIELQDLKANLNEPSTYDYDSDWNAFRA